MAAPEKQFPGIPEHESGIQVPLPRAQVFRKTGIWGEGVEIPPTPHDDTELACPPPAQSDDDFLGSCFLGVLSL